MKRILAHLLAAAIGFGAAATAAAQTDFPNKTVRILVGYSPGGATDLLARAVAEALGRKLGQTFIVENRQGAAGVVAAQYLKTQPADGYTLMMATSGAMAIPQNFGKLPYDPLTDFVTVAQVVANDLVMIVGNNSPIKNYDDFVKTVKAEGDRFSYGVSGRGSITHVAGERLKYDLGLKMTVVPYRGDSMAFADTIGGALPASFVAMASISQAVKANQVRALFVTGSKRLTPFPDIPTLAELGLKDFVMASWIGLFAPAGTPPAVLKKLSDAVGEVMADPAMIEKLESSGSRVEFRDSAGFDGFFRKEVDSFARIIRDAKVTAD